MKAIFNERMRTGLLLFFCLFIAVIACNNSKQVRSVSDDKEMAKDTFKKPFPKPVGYVNDFYRLFNNKEHKSLDSLIAAYEKNTATQIAIVTLDSSYVPESDFDAYSLSLARQWRVGPKENNKGILIALCPDFRRIRIQNGIGIEPYLSDAETKMVIDSVMLPEFRKAGYYKGLYDGIIAITKKLDEAGLR